MKQTKAEKAIEARIHRAYYATCVGVQIGAMILMEGRKAIAEGVDDEVLGQRVRAYVESIRKN